MYDIDKTYFEWICGKMLSVNNALIGTKFYIDVEMVILCIYY
jgi:hypothetical protein